MVLFAWHHGCVAKHLDPGGLDPSIVENTQVLQFAVHVKQRVPFAEQVASGELVPGLFVKLSLFGQRASRA